MLYGTFFLAKMLSSNITTGTTNIINIPYPDTNVNGMTSVAGSNAVAGAPWNTPNAKFISWLKSNTLTSTPSSVIEGLPM
jgi:hypothetical protein